MDAQQKDNCEGIPEKALAAKIVLFVSFCIECYKARHGISGQSAAALFQRYGVEKYLYEEYDTLHSFGEGQILDYIERFMEVRKEAAP